MYRNCVMANLEKGCCNALKKTYCDKQDGCDFFKTKEDYEREIKRVEKRLKSLGMEIPERICFDEEEE